MRSLLISLNILCFYLIMSSGAMGQNVNINETPKQFEVNQAIPLPGNGSLTVAVEPRDKWKDEARNGTAIGLKLSFASPSTKALSFKLKNVFLRIGEKALPLYALAVEHRIPTKAPRFVLRGDEVGNLGLTVRGNAVFNDGFIIRDKDTDMRFIGHTVAPLFFIFEVPDTIADQPAVLSLNFELDEKSFSASVKIKG